jgi:hypothetical protein
VKVQDLRARLDELEVQSQQLEARRERLELPSIDGELLASLEDQLEKMRAAGRRARKKNLLHRLEKKVLAKDRLTVEIWYGLPNQDSVRTPAHLARRTAGPESRDLRLPNPRAGTRRRTLSRQPEATCGIPRFWESPAPTCSW